MNLLSKYNWLLPVLIFISLLLGTIGFYQYYEEAGQPTTWFTSLYLSLQLFVLNSGGVFGKLPILLEIARFMAPALTAGSILLAIWQPFHHNYQLFKIRFWKDHLVVCGLSKKAELLIHDFLKTQKGKIQIVLIEHNENHHGISEMKKKGVIVLKGNAADTDMLHKANLFTAKYLLALTNDERVNIQIAQKATHLFNHFPGKVPVDGMLQVILHIDDFYTMNIFKEFHEKAIPEDHRYRSQGSTMDYHVFSIYQLAAAFLVDKFSPDQYVPLTGEQDPPAHILVVGDNLAAQYLIMEAGEMYHFANLKKTKITMVADDPGQVQQKIESLYPFLGETVLLTYTSTATFFSEDCPIPCDEISMCFVALEDDGKSVYFSRKLRQFIFRHGRQSNQSCLASFEKGEHFSRCFPPIKALLPRNTALVNIFSDVLEEMKSLNIELLNLDDEVCNVKTIVDNRKVEDFIAKHIHYEWAKNHAAKNNISIGTMQEEWDKLKDAQKDSNRFPARHLNIKLRFANAEMTDSDGGEEFNFNNMDAETWDKIARMEHNRWVAEKLINGYVLTNTLPDRKLASFLNTTLKVHQDLIPYDDLPTDTQEYDKFTFKMAPEIARLNNKRIVKRNP